MIDGRSVGGERLASPSSPCVPLTDTTRPLELPRAASPRVSCVSAGEAKARCMDGNHNADGPHISGKCGQQRKGHTCLKPNGPRIEKRDWKKIWDPDDAMTYEAMVQKLAAKGKD